MVYNFIHNKIVKQLQGTFSLSPAERRSMERIPNYAFQAHHLMQVRTLVLLVITIIGAKSLSSTISSKSEAIEFFNETYISRLSGDFDPKLKRFTVPGFHPSWGLLSLHHVCFKPGVDGMFVGLTDVPNDWDDRVTEVNRGIHPEKLDQALKEKDVYTTFKPMRLNFGPNTNHENAAVVLGSTYMMNCVRQPLRSYNPAHLLMKYGVWYEMADTQQMNNGRNIFNATKLSQVKVPFDHISFQQCSSPFFSNWTWGQVVHNLVKGKSISAGLTNVNTSYNYFGYRRTEDTGDILCFEDVVLSVRLGNWIQGRAHLVKFRQDTYALLKEPAEVATNPEKLQVVHGTDTLDTRKNRMDYCGHNGSSITSARIKIFQRTNTKMLRRFVNLDEVKALCQSYTTVPVEIVTVNTSSSVEDQIRLFNSFDILVTSHGSHLGNGLFTMHPETKAIVEIVSFVFDHVFYGNYNCFLGFADYIMSSGHPTYGKSATGPNPFFGVDCPFPTVSDFAKNNCTDITLSDTGKKGLKRYANKIQQTWKTCPDKLQTRSCDTNVDISLLKSHFDKLFSESLCRPV